MKMLSDFQAGATVKYHGEPCIVLEHRKDGTLLMVLEQIEHTFGSDNDFAKSDLREHLNGAYMDTLTQGSHGEILKRAIDLTPQSTVASSMALTPAALRHLHLMSTASTMTSSPSRKNGNGLLPLGAPPAWMEMKPGSWAWTPMAMSTTTAATIPTGPVPLSSSPLIMLWSRKMPLHPTPQESWLRNFSAEPTSKRWLT